MSRRILFLGDRPEIAQQPVLRLQLEGYEVDQVDSQDAGADALAEAAYDLLVLDAELPEADGWRVLQELREHPDFGGTKVIVLMAGKGETGRLALVPVDAELRRPFTMADLLEAVKRVLGGE